MNKKLRGMGITIHFFQEILEFEVGQYHSNYKLQHFQGRFYAQEKNH